MTAAMTLETLRAYLDRPQIGAHALQVYQFEMDLQFLALTMWGEGRNQSIRGRVAIGWVVKNRARPGSADKSIRHACLRAAQFSCWHEEGKNRTDLLALADVVFHGGNAGPLYAECKYLANGVIQGLLLDPTRGSTHYLTRSLYESPKAPLWSREAGLVDTAIEDHIFLRGVR